MIKIYYIIIDMPNLIIDYELIDKHTRNCNLDLLYVNLIRKPESHRMHLNDYNTLCPMFMLYSFRK